MGVTIGSKELQQKSEKLIKLVNKVSELNNQSANIKPKGKTKRSYIDNHLFGESTVNSEKAVKYFEALDDKKLAEEVQGLKPKHRESILEALKIEAQKVEAAYHGSPEKTEIKSFQKDTVQYDDGDRDNFGGKRTVVKINELPNTQQGIENIKQDKQPTKGALKNPMSAKVIKEAMKVGQELRTEQNTAINKSSKSINPVSAKKTTSKGVGR